MEELELFFKSYFEFSYASKKDFTAASYRKPSTLQKEYLTRDHGLESVFGSGDLFESQSSLYPQHSCSGIY
jgi:hypothetical protein